MIRDIWKNVLIFKILRSLTRLSCLFAQGPALMCSICQKEGHLKQSCPDEVLPEIRPLPKMTPQFQEILSSILTQVPCKYLALKSV